MIKTIMFDFAGVITTSALFPRVADEISKKYNLNRTEFLNSLKANEEDYLLGNCSTKNFYDKVCKNLNVDYKDFIKEISFYEINYDVLNLIKNLKLKYKIILVSDNYEALYEQIYNDSNLKDLFDASFYSNKLQMVKLYDEDKIFNHVLNKLQIIPEESVFIDDKEKNLISPKKLGIKTILFKDFKQLKKELSSYGVDLN